MYQLVTPGIGGSSWLDRSNDTPGDWPQWSHEMRSSWNWRQALQLNPIPESHWNSCLRFRLYLSRRNQFYLKVLLSLLFLSLFKSNISIWNEMLTMLLCITAEALQNVLTIHDLFLRITFPRRGSKTQSHSRVNMSAYCAYYVNTWKSGNLPNYSFPSFTSFYIKFNADSVQESTLPESPNKCPRQLRRYSRTFSNIFICLVKNNTQSNYAVTLSADVDFIHIIGFN